MGISVIGADGEGNNFSVDVGASGNNVVVFDKEYAAGAYSITSQLADSTLDIYAVNADGTLAGYTNTKALSCSKGFSKLVIYGATTNDLLTFEFKITFSPTESGTLNSGVAPFLTSATPATLASVDDTTTVTGGNFASDVEIVFTGQDDVDRPAKNIVRSNSTSLIVTRPDDFPIAQEPYSITATNPGISNPSVIVNKLVDYFDAGGGITWVTTSPLTAASINSSYNTTLEATDADATSVGYSLTAGSLPTGLSLNGSTGVISGTPTVQESQTFTITATDAGGNSSSREFTLSVANLTVEYLVIAGGGAGGTSGGGGAGGYRCSVSGESSGGGASAEAPLTINLATNYTVTVGAGGTGVTGTGVVNGGSGSNSVFGSITSSGGGGGGSNDGSGGGVNGSSGGSGGGGSLSSSTAGVGGTGTEGQGFAGGTGIASGSLTGAGGGGAGEAGSNAISGTGGAGGDGVASSITGGLIYRAGGGGGNGAPTTPGAGGLGGGATGGNNNGIENTGGGGGASKTGTTGSGGAGVVILSYSAQLNITVGAGLSSYTLTDGTKKVTVFTAGSDSISFDGAEAEVVPVEYLVIAGGAGGNTSNGGGGGAGGYRSSVGSSGGNVGPELDFAFTVSEAYSVTVGAGGSTSGSTSSSGVNSSLGGLVSIGGGRPANRSQTVLALSGGSGGGGASTSAVYYLRGAQGVPGQGFGGGNGVDLSGYQAGGGGGAGEAGNTDGLSHGGDGLASDITGTSVSRGGGGAGGANSGTYPGGVGGGGNGGTSATSGGINTGGGGGSTGNATAGSGGSGVVILRYPASKTLTVGAGLTADPPATVGANKVTVIKSGTGTVTLS